MYIWITLALIIFFVFEKGNWEAQAITLILIFLMTLVTIGNFII